MNKSFDLKDVPAAQTYGAEAFISEDYARAEGEKLWPKVWQHACRVEEIPAVGDYVTYDVLDDTIVVIRTEPNKIQAFFNVCQHRGRRLVDGCGNIKQFFCKYHAWRYSIKGENTFVLDKDDWGGALSQDRLNLQEVKVDTWGGFVWINMDPNAEPLRDYLGIIPGLADPFELEKMRYRWRVWCVFDCNWKVALEAFSEAYHVEGTHPQLMKYAEFYTWSRAAGRHSHKGFTERDASLAVSESNSYYRPGRGDPRKSIYELQEETYRTANASTTQTMVNAAKRLVDELPEGTPTEKVMAHWMESARRDDAARGVIWPTVSSEHIGKVGNSVHIFPNMSIGIGLTFALCYRTRPYKGDPNKCIFEGYVIERFPEGKEPKTEWVYAEPTDTTKWPPVLTQDFENMSQVQRGMRSRGFRGALPNPRQEETVTNIHRNLAQYMGTGAPRPLKESK